MLVSWILDSEISLGFRASGSQGLGFRFLKGIYKGLYKGLGFRACILGVRIRGTLGDIDPLNKVPFKRARSSACILGSMQ